MDDQVFTAVNGFARATPWLHGLLLGYANYGVVLFAVLLGWGWWIARQRGSGMPAALWAPLGTLLAVALVSPSARSRRSPGTCWCGVCSPPWWCGWSRPAGGRC
jgi:undecaprenyl-diphosphatase